MLQIRLMQLLSTNIYIAIMRRLNCEEQYFKSQRGLATSHLYDSGDKLSTNSAGTIILNP